MSEHKDVEARLAEIEAYVEAATPGPWTFPGTSWSGVAYVLQGGRDRVIAHINGPEEAVKANGTFIARSRTDLPALLAVARAAAALLYDAPWIPESTQVRPYAERVHLALAALGGQGQEVEK